MPSGKVGYYRYKITNLRPGTYLYKWTVDGEVKCISKVVVKPKCDESVYVKYLDRYGMYRFILFNSYWQRSESTSSLGEVESVNSYGQISSLGSDLSEVYTLTAENVTPEELAVYGDIYSSPNIYMKIGDGDWKTMILTGGDYLNRRNRKYNSKFQIQLTDKNTSTIIK